MIDNWQEMSDFWYKMGGKNLSGSPDGPRVKQGCDLALALFMEVSELVDSFQWKPWRNHTDIDKDNLAREIVDCLFFLHHLADNFGLSERDLLKKYDQVMENNIRRYIDGDFSSEEELEDPPSNAELAQINAKLDQIINGDTK